MILKTAVMLLCLVSLASPCLTKEKKGDLPRVVIADVKIAPGGEMVLAVRLFASKARELNLSGGTAASLPEVTGEPSPDNAPTPLPFTLNGSTLTDLDSKAVYTNLPSLPNKPFVGSMEMLISIKPGGWIQMGVAFPPLPPPSEKKGKKQPYRLRLDIPQLKVSSVVRLDPDTFKVLDGGE